MTATGHGRDDQAKGAAMAAFLAAGSSRRLSSAGRGCPPDMLSPRSRWSVDQRLPLLCGAGNLVRLTGELIRVPISESGWQ